MTESHRVGRFFDKTSDQFDAIYTNENVAVRTLNRLLRRDVYERFEITMRECSPASGQTVLDVGCGSGPYVVALAKSGAHVTGIDLSPQMVRLAKDAVTRAGQTERVDLAVADVMDLRPVKMFTYVIAMGVFDYVGDAKTMIAHLARFAERKLVISFPKRWFPRSQLRAFRYGLRNCPVYFYTKDEVRRLGATLESRSVRIVEIAGPGYDYVLSADF
jgi:2-polyprenyl-3-methyl-5-hydroxy-6-metoxy-1,4-benzoquinol methylase